MPVKNSRKQFMSGGIYHVYNRGINKGRIFFQENDYYHFISLLSRYVSKPKKFENLGIRNYYKKVQILAFCLMDNHYHFLIRQFRKKVISEFMRSVSISYTLYINRRYKRVGHLFQGVYKARLIGDVADLMATSKYIHSNPGGNYEELVSYPFSSLKSYLCRSEDFPFLNTEEILSKFSDEKVATTMYKNYLSTGSDPRSDPFSQT